MLFWKNFFNQYISFFLITPPSLKDICYCLRSKSCKKYSTRKTKRFKNCQTYIIFWDIFLLTLFYWNKNKHRVKNDFCISSLCPHLFDVRLKFYQNVRSCQSHRNWNSLEFGTSRFCLVHPVHDYICANSCTVPSWNSPGNHQIHVSMGVSLSNLYNSCLDSHFYAWHEGNHQHHLVW